MDDGHSSKKQPLTAEEKRAYRRQWGLDNKEKLQEYRRINKDKEREQTRQWRKDHPEQVREMKRRYYAAHKEYIRTYRQSRMEMTRDSRIAYLRQWRKDHPEYGPEYDAANREKKRQQERERYADDPTQKIASAHRHRARKLQAPVCDFTLSQWQAIQEAYKYCCAYCGKQVLDGLTQDHIIPLSKGGSHTYTNIVPACRSCNSKKGVKNPLIPVQPFLLLAVKDAD